MPELPELETIAYKLTEQVTGQRIKRVRVENHLLLHRITVEDFQEKVKGTVLEAVRADGKFLLFDLDDKYEIIINPMLTGRIRLTNPSRKPGKQDVFRLLVGTQTLWYRDRKQMGRVYLVDKGQYEEVADFLGRGPSALDKTLTLEAFEEKMQKRRGQVKGVLRNQRFITGIGNAYADEILLFAGINPFRKCNTLTEEEIEKLYTSMRKVLMKFKKILMKRTIEQIGLEKRDFLMIHGKTNGVCPLCGNRVSEVKSNRFKTNYCQQCQQ